VFVVVMVTCMSFASGIRELRRSGLSMIETHIVMSSLIFRLMLHLALLHMLFLGSLIDLTIAYMVLVHERIALSLDALVMTRVLIVVNVFRIGLIFLRKGLILTLSRDTWTVHVFPIVVHVPLSQVMWCKRL
jgi:hypothetical protein